ncbi:MAG: RnfH family protein [Gammaproteobacteria bacterium]|jgi:putative ubiquitin-RnfH superfamily antitoxin RatB of RatAB toxin-antitoxin module|nr:RnfH family protein [Gammaproteobacteria bacterium]
MVEQRGGYLGIEVVYAEPARQRLVRLQVAAGTTAREAALHSALDKEFAGLDLARVPVGVFGERVADSYELRAGDRVELYRPLRTDPREARRQAAASGRTVGGADV